MDKPTKPSNLMPRSFGGVKNNWTSGMQASGYEDGVPAIYGGDNLNYQLDATGKELDYCEKIVDFINEIPIGKTITVDNNNKLVYDNLSTVARTGSYNDLLNKPTIPSVDNFATKDLDNLTTTGNNKILPSQSGNSGKYLTTNGTSPSWTDFTGANKDLSNLTTNGNDRFHACKGYEDAGELLTDAEGLADVKKYAHSTFDVSKFEKYGDDITITTDGIASGFASNNYLKINSTINATSQIIIKERVIWANGIGQGLCSGYYSGNSEAFICFTGDNNLNLRLHDDGSTLLTVPVNANANDIVDILIQITLSVSVNGGTPVTQTRANPIVSFDLSGVSYYIGSTYVGTAPTLGQIDLKYVTIYDTANNFYGTQTGTDDYYIGGSTILIPYSLSKTGSKIVMHEAYRSAVSSVYNAYGFAPYYTLNATDTNFTIPQGEIYGMMLNRSTPHIIEKYEIQSLGYILYSDKTLVQYGRKAVSWTSGNAVTVTIYPIKNFSSASYNIQLTLTGYSHTSSGTVGLYAHDMGTSSFQVDIDPYNAGAGSGYIDWYITGRIA